MNVLDFTIRLMFSAPLLFIAVLMIFDPRGTLRMIRSFPSALADLPLRIQGVPVVTQRGVAEASDSKRWPVVAMGVILATGAVFVLASTRA